MFYRAGAILFFSILIVQYSCRVARIKKEISSVFSAAGNHSKLPVSIFLDSVKNRDKFSREQVIIKEILSGNYPSFLSSFAAVKIKFNDSVSHHRAVIFVAKDYLSVGDDSSFFRIPMQPKTAQLIAGSFHCVLPTTKIVDEIYKHATVKLAPQPLTEKRDSAETFFYHHQLIEEQRNKRSGLIAGIKKDVVTTAALYSYPKTGRVAIYGWHQPDGKPIQPLYLGHVNWYVDYSHGVRLIYEKMLVDGKIMFIKDVLKNNELKKIICAEENCAYYIYQ